MEDKDLAKLIDEIREISESASAGNMRDNTKAIVLSMHKNALVMHELSMRSARSTQKVVGLTWAIFYLTFAMLIFSAFELYLSHFAR